MSRYPNPFPNHIPIDEFNKSPERIGTGDITGPPDPPPVTSFSLDPEGERERLRPLYPTLPWEKLDEKAVKASKRKREWLAERLARGKLRTPGQIKAAALRLGCEPREVERQKMTPAMERLVAERLRRVALYATAEATPYQAELAKTDVASYKAVAQIGEALKPAGVSVQTNIAVDQRNGGDNMNDAKWFENFQARALRNLPALEAVTEAVEIEPSGTD